MSELQHYKYLKKREPENDDSSSSSSFFTKLNNQNQLYKLFIYKITKNIKSDKIERKLISINDNINLLNLLYTKLENGEEVNDDINNYNNENFKGFLKIELLNTQSDIKTKIELIDKILKAHQSIKENIEKNIKDSNINNINLELDKNQNEITESMIEYIKNEIESMMKSISIIRYIKQNNIKFTLYDQTGKDIYNNWDTIERRNQFKTASYDVHINISKFYDLSCYVYIYFNNRKYIFNVTGNNININEKDKDYTLLSFYKNNYDSYIINIRVLLLNLIICLTSNHYYSIGDYTILRGLLNKDTYENYQSSNNYIIPAFIKDFKKYGLFNTNNKEEEEEIINLLLIPNYLEYLNNINSYIESEINLYSHLWIDEQYIPLILIEPSFYKKLHVPLNLSDLNLNKKDIILDINKNINMKTEYDLLLENENENEDLGYDYNTSLFQDNLIKNYIKDKEEELKEIKENIDNAQTNLENIKDIMKTNENYDIQKIINNSISTKEGSSSNESNISNISTINKEESEITSSSPVIVIDKKKEEEESSLNSTPVVEHKNTYQDVDDFYRQLKKEHFK
jgi:hypothetical protein